MSEEADRISHLEDRIRYLENVAEKATGVREFVFDHGLMNISALELQPVLHEMGRALAELERFDSITVTHHWVTYYGGADHIAKAGEIPNGKTLCGRPVQHHHDWPLRGMPPTMGTCVLCREMWSKEAEL